MLPLPCDSLCCCLAATIAVCYCCHCVRYFAVVASAVAIWVALLLLRLSCCCCCHHRVSCCCCYCYCCRRVSCFVVVVIAAAAAAAIVAVIIIIILVVFYSCVTLFLIIWFSIEERRDWFCEKKMCVYWILQNVHRNVYILSIVSLSVECLLHLFLKKEYGKSRSKIDRTKRLSFAPPVPLGELHLLYFPLISTSYHWF